MVATHLVLVLSDLPGKTVGRVVTLEVDWAGRWVDTGGRLCPRSCILKAASQEKEASMS